MKKPLIGITPQYDIEKNRIFIGSNYINSILNTGGIPVLLPLFAEYEDLKHLVASLDGFLFSGGPDICPSYFKEEPIKNYGVIVPSRDLLEENLFHIALDTNKPMLGICRGMQVFNVFLGGSLYQDIYAQHDPSYILKDNQLQKYQIEHFQKSQNEVLTHKIYISKGTLLHKITNTNEIRVNSFHHQGVKRIPFKAIPCAFAVDDIVEAIEIPTHPYFLGVQWHPEHLTSTCSYSKMIFRSFIDAC